MFGVFCLMETSADGFILGATNRYAKQGTDLSAFIQNMKNNPLTYNC
jgi:hypothetical protein